MAQTRDLDLVPQYVSHSSDWLMQGCQPCKKVCSNFIWGLKWKKTLYWCEKKVFGVKKKYLGWKTVFSPIVQYTCVVINLEGNAAAPPSIFLNPALFWGINIKKQYKILQKSNTWHLCSVLIHSELGYFTCSLISGFNDDTVTFFSTCMHNIHIKHVSLSWYEQSGSISSWVNPFSTGTGWTLYKVYGGFRISYGMG